VTPRISLAALALALLAGTISGQTYRYDAAGRLTQITLADGTTTVYAYDAAGNVMTQTTTPQPPGAGGADGSGGCFIATAAYGSPLHPHVQELRVFRDRFLLPWGPGRAFVRGYERWSPPLADFLVEHPALRAPARMALAPLVYGVAYPRTGLVVLLGGLLSLCAWRKRVRAGAPRPAA
jgi:YD repeat-containing protein